LETQFVYVLRDDGLKFHPMRLTSTRPTISTNKPEPTVNQLNRATLLSEARLRELPNPKRISLRR
jgi:hypothetical protein